MLLLLSLYCPTAYGASPLQLTAPVRPAQFDTSVVHAPLSSDAVPSASAGAATSRLLGEPEGVRFFGSALYWTVREGGADNWAQVITPKGLLGSYVGTATLVDAPFEWSAGMRVGIGYQRIEGGHDVALCYTNFSTRATNQAAGEVYSAFLGNFFVGNTDGASFGPHYRSASIQWDFDFHSIDFDFGRTFALSRGLVVRPFLGVKSAIINQTVHSHWRQPIDTLENIYLFDSATEDLSQKFWGVGPSLGVTLQMPLSARPQYGLSLFATPSGALMHGRWTFKDVYENDGPTSLEEPTRTSIAIESSPITGAATMLGATVGLHWSQHFARATTSVRVGYEVQAWLNQMQFYSYNMGRLNNLMSMHGAAFELRINY